MLLWMTSRWDRLLCPAIRWEHGVQLAAEARQGCNKHRARNFVLQGLIETARFDSAEPTGGVQASRRLHGRTLEHKSVRHVLRQPLCLPCCVVAGLLAALCDLGGEHRR